MISPTSAAAVLQPDSHCLHKQVSHQHAAHTLDMRPTCWTCNPHAGHSAHMLDMQPTCWIFCPHAGHAMYLHAGEPVPYQSRPSTTYTYLLTWHLLAFNFGKWNFLIATMLRNCGKWTHYNYTCLRPHCTNNHSRKLWMNIVNDTQTVHTRTCMYTQQRTYLLAGSRQAGRHTIVLSRDQRLRLVCSQVLPNRRPITHDVIYFVHMCKAWPLEPLA